LFVGCGSHAAVDIDLAQKNWVQWRTQRRPTCDVSRQKQTRMPTRKESVKLNPIQRTLRLKPLGPTASPRPLRRHLTDKDGREWFSYGPW